MKEEQDILIPIESVEKVLAAARRLAQAISKSNIFNPDPIVIDLDPIEEEDSLSLIHI